MGLLTKKMRVGVLLGFGLPIFFLGASLVYFDFEPTEINTLAGIASLCALPNLVLFFGALRKNNDLFAYGVLVSSILWALFTFGLKLFG